MASVVKKLVTKWVYEVDAKQLIAAEQRVQKLQKSIISAISASDKLSMRQNKHFNDMQVNFNKLTSSVKKYKEQMAAINLDGSVRGRGGHIIGGMGGGSKKSSKSGGGGRSLRGHGGISTRLGSGGLTMMGFGLSGAISMGVFKGIKGVISSGAAREDVETSFGTMLKSKSKAAQLINNLNALAAKSPFEVGGIRDNARRILGAGFQQSEVVPMLKQLGDLAQGDGAVLRRMVVNLSEIKNNNKASIRDIRQFSTAGIDIMTALSKVTGKDKDQIGDMISSNKITFAIVKKALDQLTGKDGIFYQSMQKKSLNLTGKWSNFQDNLNILAEEISASGFGDGLKGMVDSMNTSLENPETRKTWTILLSNALKDSLDFIGDIIPALKNLDTAFIGLPKWVAFIGALAGLAAFPVVGGVVAFIVAFDDLIKTLADWQNADTFFGKLFRLVDAPREWLDRKLGQDPASLARKFDAEELRSRLKEMQTHWWGRKGGANYEKIMEALIIREKMDRDAKFVRPEAQRAFDADHKEMMAKDPLYNSPLRNQTTVPSITVNVNGGGANVGQDVIDAVNNSEWDGSPRKRYLNKKN